MHEEVDGGHGRVERRSCRQLRVTDWLSGAAQWPGLQTVIAMERARHLPGKEVEHEIQYYISSLPVDAVRVAQGIRRHWEVENKAHWVLDVAFKEDDCRIRKGDGAENVAIIRRFCVNLARLYPRKNSNSSRPDGVIQDGRRACLGKPDKSMRLPCAKRTTENYIENHYCPKKIVLM